MLKPNGTLIVTLPNVSSPFRIWQRSVWQPLLRLASSVSHTSKFEPVITAVPHREFAYASHRRLYEELGTGAIAPAGVVIRWGEGGDA